MAGARKQARADLIVEIKRLARQQIAVDGAPNLSLRAISRELGMVSSAIYRYFPSRDQLLTALIIDAYDSLGESVLSDPLPTFRGGRDPTATALTGGVMYFDSWNHHVLTVQAPAFSSTDFTLQPPGLLVNGRQWPTLKVRFQRVTEDVCRPAT